MLWSKQHYHYDVNYWLHGDSRSPQHLGTPRRHGRNSQWKHLVNNNIISMPDKWEYPWYAAWDLAFHCLPLARLDPAFAKRQLVIMLREYYMHPNGQIPAYEWNFSDVNPPVHAWSAWKVYTIDRAMNGTGDVEFLEKVFHKLLMNFTWWVNRKDSSGNNLFEGGFLGLDNIGCSTVVTDCPVGATWNKRTPPPGWRCTRSTCCASPWRFPRPGPTTRRWPRSSSTTFCRLPGPCSTSARRTWNCGTIPTPSTTT